MRWERGGLRKIGLIRIGCPGALVFPTEHSFIGMFTEMGQLMGCIQKFWKPAAVSEHRICAHSICTESMVSPAKLWRTLILCLWWTLFCRNRLQRASSAQVHAYFSSLSHCVTNITPALPPALPPSLSPTRELCSSAAFR